MEQESVPNPDQPKQEDVISTYMYDIEHADIEFHQTVVKKARNALFVAAVLIFCGEMVSMAKNGGEFSTTVFIIALIEGGLFAGFAVWTKWKPYTAVMSGLITFIVIISLGVLLNGYTGGIGQALMSLISGVFFKIFILAALVNALKNAKTLQRIQKSGI